MSVGLKEKLFSAFEDRQIGRFQRILKEFKNAGAIDDTEILKKICHASNSSPFLKAYVDAGGSLQKVYDGKHAIHWAAESLNMENMKILLGHDQKLANQLDSNSFTPLHFVINATTAGNLMGVFEAIKLLIQQNADINLSSQPTKVDTPFNLLVEKLKSVPDKKKRQEILDYIDQCVTFIDINTPKRGEIQQLLQVYHPKLLLRLASNCYDGMNTSEVIGKMLDHLDMDEKKMIQDLYSLRTDPMYTNVIQEVFDDGTLLEESIKKGLVSSVKMLLRAGADPFRTFAKRQPAIMVACFYGNPNIVELILDSRPVFDCSKYPEPLLHHVIRNFKKKGFYEPDTNHYKVFDLVINNANTDVNELDAQRHSALYHAIRKNDKVSIRKLLRKHAFIGSMCEMSTTMPFDSIDPELMEQYFDTCISSKDKNSNPGDDGYELCFNYTCFKPPTGELGAVNELTTINYIASKKKFQHLMSHPLITSFLFLKWYPLSPIFYANLLYYAFICLMLVVYIVFMYGPEANNNGFRWVPFVFAMSILLRELGQFLFSPKRYILSIANYVELLLATLTWLVFCDGTCLVNQSARRAIGAVVILLAVMELTILIGSLPIFSISTYMIMLKKVTITFLRIFCLYSLILGAFACSFYKLFTSPSDEDASDFSNLALSFLKTIVMFTGEYDAGNLNFRTSLWMGYTLFVAFIFFISIVMMNLLSGLAVSDTQTIRTKAALIDWIERAKLLTRYEQTMLKLTNWIPDVFKSNVVSIRIYHYANGSVIIPMIVRESISGVDGGDETAHSSWWRWFNWFLKKILIFDYEIVKQAINVMDMCASREQEEKHRKKEENRMNGIEQTLNEVLQMMKSNRKQEKGQSKSVSSAAR